MKNQFLIAFLMILGISGMQGQQKVFTEEIKSTIKLNTQEAVPLLELKNINGSITVEGYNGSTVEMTVAKKITSRTTTGLEKGKSEIKIETITNPEGVLIRLDGPCFNWDGRSEFKKNRDCEVQRDYEFYFDFTLKVPYETNLKLSTVNNGEVFVKNTRGKLLKTANVNGGITLEEVAGQTWVNCVNGDVSISYAENPTSESTYYALNGDINIEYRSDLSAEVGFKSLNGEIYTDFTIAGQYTKTRKEDPKNSKKGKYRYEASSILQIGRGEVYLDFETLNGNVYLKKS